MQRNRPPATRRLRTVVRALVPRSLRAESGGLTGRSTVWFGLWGLWLALVIFLIEAPHPWSAELWEKPIEDFRCAEWVPLGLWWGAAVNLVVCSLLIATARWWLNVPKPERQAECAAPARPTVGWLLAVLGAVVLAAWLGWPRMSLSLWGDEEHSLRQCVLGEHRIDEATGDLYYRPRPISENLWMYVGPNNHFLFTLTSRICLEVWHATTWQGGLYFDETVFRLPSFVAGLLLVAALAGFLRSAGFPVAGVLAAWFLVIHPWFLRYMAEARGYALMMLFAVLAATFLLVALRNRTWKSWGLFALCEFLFLYAYPGALYLAATLNAGALAAILLRGFSRETGAQLWHWAVANTFAAMVAIQLLAPCVPQMALWLQRDRAKAELGLPFVQDVWAFTTSGMAWHVWDASNPFCHTLETLSEAHPAAFQFLLWIPVLLLPLGLLRFSLRGLNHAAVAIGLAAAAPAGFVLTQAAGNVLYVWYLIFALPAYVAFAALGIDTAAWVFVRPWRNLHLVAPGLLAVFVLGGFFWATTAQRETLRTVPTEPQSDSVLLTRPSLDPYHPSAGRITTVNVTFTTPSYDPRAIKLDDDASGAAELARLMSEARRQGHELYVNLGSEGLARHLYPQVMAMLDDPREFELVGRLYGLEQQNTRLVFRMLPGEKELEGEPSQQPAHQNIDESPNPT